LNATALGHESAVLLIDSTWNNFPVTRQLPPWNECVVSGCPLIQPQPIPPLTHRQVCRAIRVLNAGVINEQDGSAGTSIA
jgi:hypothetical protein